MMKFDAVGKMRILLAEDEPGTAAFIAEELAQLGYAITTALSGQEALEIAIAQDFDVIVLDRMLPELEGIEVLKKLRKSGCQTPVLLLTAKGAIADRVAGLEAGAEDYLVKPFAMPELAARIAVLLRRRLSSDAPMRHEVGDVVMDILRRQVRRGEREIHLQPREFAILELLMRNAGKIVTRTMFLEEVWGFYFDPETNIVESHLSRMRSKLRGDHATDLIETIRGSGYRMRADE